MAVTIAKKARTAVAIAVISPDRSTDMGEAYGVPQGVGGGSGGAVADGSCCARAFPANSGNVTGCGIAGAGSGPGGPRNLRRGEQR